MSEPPPDVASPEHRQIWYAACRLLEENSLMVMTKGNALTSLAVDGENGDDVWNNSDDVKEKTCTAKRA